MAERKDDVQRLESVLDESDRDQRKKEVKIEEIRVGLERISIDAAEKYYREVESLLPEAQRLMHEVVRPYFSDLTNSGTYQRLMQWARSHDKYIHLSDTIHYYWPSRALKGYSEVQRGRRAFRETARFISQNTYPSREEALRRHGSGDEVWSAYFYLRNSKWDSKGNGVILDRDPTVGMGFGAAMSRQFRRVSADANDIASLFNTISPEVWISLGQQIENGTVLKNIEASIRPRKRRDDEDDETVSGSDYREEAVQIRDTYLQTRQWH